MADYLVHFAFLQREILASEAGFIVNQPLWVLSMDAGFYVVLPLIASAYLRRPLSGLAVALAVSAVWWAAFIEPHTPAAAQEKLDWLVQLPLFLADFACGMTAAWAFVRLREINWARTGATVAVF